jgi:hypothetical protein
MAIPGATITNSGGRDRNFEIWVVVLTIAATTTDREPTIATGNIESRRRVVTYVSDMETTIKRIRDGLDGDVCSRSRVVDGLLDVRLEAGERHDIVSMVDAALAELPGRNMVPVDWWREQLDMFELAAIGPVEPVC